MIPANKVGAEFVVATAQFQTMVSVRFVLKQGVGFVDSMVRLILVIQFVNHA